MPWRRSTAPPPPDDTLVAPPPPEAPPGAPPPEPVPPPPREWWPWMLALLILVLGGLLAGWLLTRDTKDENATTTVSVTQPSDTATTTTAQTVALPRVVGMRSPQAVETLRTKGLRAVVRSVASDKADGIVVAQDPQPGAEVKPGSEVRLNVSKGPQDVPVAAVVGKTEQQALDELQTAGFAVATFDVPSAEAKGTVVAQDPAGGTQAKRGSRTRINVSTGSPEGQTTPRPPPPPPTTTPANVTVPGLVGQNRKSAADQIRALGLKVTIRYVPSEEAVGTVVSQSPAAGTTVKRGEGVLINLSFGPGGEQTAKTVPNVMGNDEQTARSTLQSAGFAVEVWRLRVSKPSQNGIVVDEQPGGGQRAPQGSTVAMTVGSTSG